MSQESQQNVWWRFESTKKETVTSWWWTESMNIFYPCNLQLSREANISQHKCPRHLGLGEFVTTTVYCSCYIQYCIYLAWKWTAGLRDTCLSCMLTWISPRASRPEYELSSKQSHGLKLVRNYSPHLTKTTNPTVLGSGLRMPIPHCFSGSSRAAAASTLRCTMRKNRRWRAPSTTARTPSTSSRARSSSMTTWMLRL